jgi:hypothetical protein
MRIVELIIDEKDEQSGIDAISVVMSPAIESNFIHLSKHEIVLKEIDAEKKILMGAALIPDKQIYRRNDKTKDEYYIYFSKATIRKASELFLMNANQNNSTLEHSQKLKGMSVVESWIIEGENDKSKNYGFDLPQGTWMISMKVNNDEIWNKVKLGEVKGFSIEGYFADRYEMNSKNIDMEEKAMIEKIKSLIEKSELKSEKFEFGLVDDLNIEVKNALNFKSKIDLMTKKTNEVVPLFNKANLILKEIEKEYSENRLFSDNISKKLQDLSKKIIAQSKDLGVNYNDSSIYKKLVETKQIVDSEYKKIQNNWDSVYKFKN